MLHVSKVYLNGLQFCDLKLVFDCGQVIDYSCSNFEAEEENRKYIEDNILFHHPKLAMGEFAIGTNTTAYVAAQKYNICLLYTSLPGSQYRDFHLLIEKCV